ncbi:MAG: hypothetical protein ACRBFS_17645 [Aureispira sp.]
MRTNLNYTDKDLIIKVQLTPGGPGSHDYNLQIMGDGSYLFASYYAASHEKKIATEDIQEILEEAKQINFIQLTEIIPPFAPYPIDDGQETNVAFWIDGQLRKTTFSDDNSMPTAIRTLIDKVLVLAHYSKEL